MKRAVSLLTLAIFLMAIMTPHLPRVEVANAQGTGYTIENVDHQIEVMYSGHVVIRDTITVNGQISDGFLIGFPYKYSSYLLKGVASSSQEILPLSLDVPLGEVSGFYGAKVTFPTGSPNTFTVIFVLSNTLLTTNSGGFFLDFPAYPSLAQEAAHCKVTLALPDEASVTSVQKGDGTVYSGKFEKNNLAAFSHFPANATVNAPEGLIRQIDVATLSRIATMGIAGEITVLDSYRISNNSTDQITSLKIEVPIYASDINVRDELGTRFSTTAPIKDESLNISSVNVTLNGPLKSGQSVSLRVGYGLPSASFDQTRFTLNLELFPYFSYYIRQISITVVPPEGARIVFPSLSSLTSSLTLDRQLFQEKIKFARDGLSYVDHELQPEKTMQIVYEYNSLWVSFRPTIWVWGLAAAGSVVLVFFRRPKTQKTSKSTKIPVPKLTTGKIESEQIRALADAYEEKMRISSEITLLSQRAQKGKMPRRQYKVQKRALELRKASLSKTISELKPTFIAAGGNYADLVKQLDTAETEVNTAEANLKVADARRKTGELTIEDYKKSISDLQKRKEKAESKFSGILLRLREEIR